MKDLKRKAELYEKMIKSRSAGGKKAASNMTPEQRKERAKKAVQARIKKYNQKVL